MNTNTNTNGSAAQTPRGARERVTFENNIPQVLTLEFDPPHEARDGNWGPQFMYFCGDKILWADPPLHEEILRSGAAATSTIAIVKRKVGRSTRWEVELQAEEPRTYTNTKAAPAPAPISAPRPTAPPPIRAGQERIAGNLMAAALKQAIEAAEAVEFAATHEDIRALAITIYITNTGGRQK